MLQMGDLGIKIPQMIVNKTMRDIKRSKIQDLTLWNRGRTALSY